MKCILINKKEIYNQFAFANHYFFDYSVYRVYFQSHSLVIPIRSASTINNKRNFEVSYKYTQILKVIVLIDVQPFACQHWRWVSWNGKSQSIKIITINPPASYLISKSYINKFINLNISLTSSPCFVHTVASVCLFCCVFSFFFLDWLAYINCVVLFCLFLLLYSQSAISISILHKQHKLTFVWFTFNLNWIFYYSHRGISMDFLSNYDHLNTKRKSKLHSAHKKWKKWRKTKVKIYTRIG